MKPTKQHYLVLGQKDVDFKTCAQCGMVYTPQKKEDKDLHKIFHKQVLLQQKSTTRNEAKSLPGLPKIIQGRLSKGSPQKSSLLYSLVYGSQTICVVWVTPYTNLVNTWNSLNCHHESSPCNAALVRLINKNEGSFQLERQPPLNTTFPVTFQVKFIWVHEKFRRQKIATEILNTIKKDQCDDVLAFNTPTTVESAFYFSFTHSLHMRQKQIGEYLPQNSNNVKLSFYCVLCKKN